MAFTGLYAKSITQGGKTFSGGEGGSIEIELVHGSRDIQDRTGDDKYPTFLALVDRFAEATAMVREPALADLPAIAAKSSLVAVIAGKSGDVTRTFLNMVVASITTRQRVGEPGMTIIRYVYEAATGGAAPE